MKTYPHNHRYWLKEHQITAFWHTFGISNGLRLPKDQIEVLPSRDTLKPTGFRIKPEYMQTLLKDYLRNLNNYKQAWDQDSDHDVHPQNKTEFLEREKSHTSRADILEMIELLQECRIDDK